MQLNLSPKKLGQFFSVFKKGQRRPTPGEGPHWLHEQLLKKEQDNNVELT